MSIICCSCACELTASAGKGLADCCEEGVDAPEPGAGGRPGGLPFTSETSSGVVAFLGVTEPDLGGGGREGDGVPWEGGGGGREGAAFETDAFRSKENTRFN